MEWFNTKRRKFFFTQCTVNLWNSLPGEYLDGQIYKRVQNTREAVTQSELAKHWCHRLSLPSPTPQTRFPDLSARAELSPSLTGFHTEQVHVGCALHGKVPMDPKFQYAYDGKDFISFDNQTGTWVAAVQPAFPQKQRWETSKTWSQYVQWFLQHEWTWGSVREGLPPQVLVSYTDSPDGSVTLSCRARGFYPRPIHISWVRDGEDVMTETDSSGILPNADGTYYTQSSLEISPQQEDRHRYACRVEHGSLGEPTLIWVPGKKGPLTPGVLAAIALAALILAGAVGAGVILWRRKSAGESRSLWSWGWACHRPPRRAHGHGTGPIPIAWACWGRSGLC
uniref:Ig-like domain-containing protein n=1 Tax=Pelusios castaneus TaxID=367368 RepID=A0A8C8SPK9_9SAUR